MREPFEPLWEFEYELETYLSAQRGRCEGWAELVRRSEEVKGERADTPREILQQPWTWWHSALEMAQALPWLRSLLGKLERVYLTGAGSSYFVGKGLDLMLRRRLEIPVESVPTTDLILHPAGYLEKGIRGLMVSFSRSGASPESVEAIRTVQQSFPGYEQLIITCNPEGELVSRFSGVPGIRVVVLDPHTCDQGLAMTSSLTSMIVAGQGLAFEGVEEYLKHVGRLCELGRRILLEAGDLALSLTALQPSRVCLLGNGVLQGMAAEGALKILEMTDGKVCTLAESFLGVRHGPLSFIDDETLVIFLVSSLRSTRRRYEDDLMREIKDKQLGMHRVGVGYDWDTPSSGLVDTRIDLASPQDSTPGPAGERVADEFLPPLAILLPQVLALGLCLECGLDPDNPSRRGTIQRVVQGLQVYTRPTRR